MVRGVGAATVLALGVLALGSPVAAQTDPASSAAATAVRVVVPDGGGGSAGAVSAPPERSASLGGWSYGDGAVSVGSISTSSRAGAGSSRATAFGSATVRSVSLFGGEVTAGSVVARSSARATGNDATGSLASSSISSLVVLGEAVEPAPNRRVALGDWGYAVVLEQAEVRHTSGEFGYRGFVTGIHVVLTAAHGGLPAGTEITIGYAEAAATAPKAKPKAPPPPKPTSPASPPKTGSDPAPGTAGVPDRDRPRDPVPQTSGVAPAPPPSVREAPSDVEPALTAGGYVFPIYGPASFTDDFGAARATTGWHHGNDIFAPLGAPVLAVTDGTLFLVGWNAVGGNRLWLRDRAGNEFYYAHLSAFSPLAREGAQVRAGDVIGFVGATGDAVGTPPHLHFEIHPRDLLWMGYDGVVNPFTYLTAWLRQDDLDFGSWQPLAGRAPRAGAVLLEADDISSLSGLGDDTLASYLFRPDLFGEAPPAPVIVGAAPGFGSG